MAPRAAGDANRSGNHLAGRLVSRLSWIVRRRTNSDLTQEIDAHVAERVDALVEQGVSIDEARARARREFGNVTLQVERSRDVWIAPWLSSIWQDVRYAARSLARQPGFAVSAVGILAIGIGLVTTLFSLINGFAWRPWTVPDPSSLAIVVPGPVPQGSRRQFSFPEYRYLREHAASFAHLAAWTQGGGPAAHGSTTRNVQFNAVSDNYFEMLRVVVSRGRAFTQEDEDYVAPRNVAIISDRLWRDFFGARESILGDVVRIYDQPFTVIGVAPPDFVGTNQIAIDVWIPLPSIALAYSWAPGNDWPKQFDNPASDRLEMAGRLAPDVRHESAAAELGGVGAQFRTSVSLRPSGYRVHDTRPLTADPGRVHQQMSVMWVGLGALFIVMLLACANVGNLILARGLSRQREIAVRFSLGAGRARIVRQLVTESVVVAMLAAVSGIWMASLAPSLIPQILANGERFSIDGVVLLFAATMALLSCLVSGVVPALRTTRAVLAAHASDRHAGRSGAGNLRSCLLATQIALSMLLLVGAGLLTRAVQHVMTFDPGFAMHDVQAIETHLPAGTSVDGSGAFARTLRAALRTDDFPAIAFSEFSALTNAFRGTSLRNESDDANSSRHLISRSVSANYFDVLGIDLVAGRTLSDDMRLNEVVLNESGARLFGSGNVLGQRLVSGTGESTKFRTVVGIVKDVPVTAPSVLQAVVYESTDTAGVLLVRDLSPAIVDRVKSVAQGIAPNARIVGRPLAEDLRDTADDVATAGAFAWGIGSLALTISTIGAFGVFAYIVEERRREIGVRMALGARAPQVLRTVVGGVRWPLILGVGAGTALSAIAAPLLSGALYGLSPFDPITYLGIAAILVVAALLATWIPARRATRIDPAITLRGD